MDPQPPPLSISRAELRSAAGARLRRRRSIEWGLVIGGSTLIVLASSMGDAGLAALRRLREDVRAIERINDGLRIGNADLRGRIRSIENDPEALEWLARRTLGYTRPGEISVRIPMDEAPSSRDLRPDSVRSSP